MLVDFHLADLSLICRIGSLEKKIEDKDAIYKLICRIGSLEIKKHGILPVIELICLCGR